jgi:hypothetical protein
VETRFGVKGTVYDGIFFTEGHIPGATVIRHLHVEISRQNADLRQIKERLAKEARDAGSATVVNFRYGQKKHPWWDLVFSFKWDTESWHGDGDAVRA